MIDRLAALASGKTKRPSEIQAEYYTRTAGQYDHAHVDGGSEHDLALQVLVALAKHYSIQSILDIGSGTGRALRLLQRDLPGVRSVGIEPVKALRDVGHASGISGSVLIDGDACKLDFPAGSFDLVCEFGALHHIQKPNVAVAEMLRVAKKAVFISDSNNFGQGRPGVRAVKNLLRSMGLWRLADYVKTRGRGYTLSEGDGLSYSYSLFDSLPLLERECRPIHLFSPEHGGGLPLWGSPHSGLFALKRQR